ncbi:hypothetical protein N7471_013016 [Penicillium samsonianum]|uniref:uncharacterized protein n=1 Tax=Penicillium samsonianum TaxID=1882272 RepID=UPI00254817E5|nr:uncharacterized protein N7471_013016 [Penicillium samsonianum]KAJ6119065.1 hypothetical protein N7471_013016 [Penicillium samsonianum]
MASSFRVPSSGIRLFLANATFAHHLLRRLKRGRLSFLFNSSNGAPRHGDKNPALHGLDERSGLVHYLSPAFNAPRLLAAHLAFLQIGELPEVSRNGR